MKGQSKAGSVTFLKFFQTVINIFYRHPKGMLKTFHRYGGYLNYRSMLRQSEKMKLYSMELPAVPSHQEGLEIYFLTGQNYFYQTLFCIHSLIRQSSVQFRFILVDDGTFNLKLINRIKKQLPNSRIIDKKTIEDNLNNRLPVSKFPVLHGKRKEYPHIKKLTDIHTIGGNSWKLVLDSDMLFWKEPTELINWLKNPDKPLHMVDCVESYGYSPGLMERLCGSQIAQLINAGSIGLNSESIIWDDLEAWVKILEDNEGKKYYLEQALSAMLIGNQASKVLDPAEYIVNPSEEIITTPCGTMHHYVDVSKKGYYRYGMTQIINQ